MPEIGDEFAGYSIERLLGRGGMGVVYLAEHIRLRQRRALKLLPPDLAHNDDFRQRFERESRLAASLEHPNIVTVFDAGEQEGLLYIAMRYIDGRDLKELLRVNGPLDPARALALLDPIAGALDDAHRRGLVHRDVKSQNILVSESSELRPGESAYLTDFGLTKHYDSTSGMTQTGTMVGTLDYMAPEQLRAGDVDARADVYSLTCVLFECLTGVVPYAKESFTATIIGHLHEDIPRLTDHRPGLAADLDAVVAEGMAKERAGRFESCGRLISAARAALGGPVTTSPTETIGAGAPAAPTPGETVRPIPNPDIAPAGAHVEPVAWQPPSPGPPAPTRAAKSPWIIAAAVVALLALAGLLFLAFEPLSVETGSGQGQDLEASPGGDEDAGGGGLDDLISDEGDPPEGGGGGGGDLSPRSFTDIPDDLNELLPQSVGSLERFPVEALGGVEGEVCTQGPEQEEATGYLDQTGGSGAVLTLCLNQSAEDAAADVEGNVKEFEGNGFQLEDPPAVLTDESGNEIGLVARVSQGSSGSVFEEIVVWSNGRLSGGAFGVASNEAATDFFNTIDF